MCWGEGTVRFRVECMEKTLLRGFVFALIYLLGVYHMVGRCEERVKMPTSHCCFLCLQSSFVSFFRAPILLLKTIYRCVCIKLTIPSSNCAQVCGRFRNPHARTRAPHLAATRA